MDEEIGAPRLGEGEQIRHHPTGADGAKTMLVDESIQVEAPQFEDARPHGGHLRIIVLDACPHPTEPGRLHGGTERVGRAEGYVMPGLGQGVCDRREWQEVAERRVAGEQRAHSSPQVDARSPTDTREGFGASGLPAPCTLTVRFSM